MNRTLRIARNAARATVFAAGCLVALASFSGAAADDVAERLHAPAVALEEIRGCIDRAEQSGGDVDDCADAASSICLENEANQTTRGSIRCSEAAAAAWDTLLNEYYTGSRKVLDADGMRALRDAQRAWIEFRDSSCAVWRAVYRGGSLAGLAVAECLRETTARRALDLRDIAFGY